MTRRNTRVAFERRIADWAERLETRVRAVTVRNMRNKWASCSTAGRLTFDKLLLSQPRELQDYVIVHELLHIHAPNHGRLWKSLMRAHLGEYEALEVRLQRASGPARGRSRAGSGMRGGPREPPARAG
jgi:predicted metal-dependent hydrolase